MTELTAITWNIHRAKGQDGVVDPGRVMDAIETDLVPLSPQILALQEADGECRPHARIIDVNRIADATGLTYVHDNPSLRWGSESDGFLGTILFLHPHFQRTNADVIDLPGHCHRGAVVVEAHYEGRALRVMSTHLSLSQPLRIVQMRVIGQYLRRRPRKPTILLGDLNEWRPWGGLSLAKRVVGSKFSGPVTATFPSLCPVFPLDRILADLNGRVDSARVIKTPLVKQASDHLALIGRVTVV